MTPIIITIVAHAKRGLTLLELEKTLDSLTIPGLDITDYEIAGLDDEDGPEPLTDEETYYEQVDYDYDRRLDK